jgi:hypothetical protein
MKCTLCKNNAIHSIEVYLDEGPRDVYLCERCQLEILKEEKPINSLIERMKIHGSSDIQL